MTNSTQNQTKIPDPQTTLNQPIQVSSAPPSRLPTVPLFNPVWFDGMGASDDDDIEDDAIADEIIDTVKPDKIKAKVAAIITDELITEDDVKPTEEQVNYGKAIWFIGAVVAIAFGFSIFKPSTQTEASLDPQPQQTVNSAQVIEQPVDAIAPVPKAEKQVAIAERDPTIQARNILLTETYNEAVNLQQQLVEARARFFFANWQRLADRNPQSYREYLLGQWRRVNGVMAERVMKSQTNLIGSAEQSAIAASLVVDAQAITLELTRLYVAEGKMESPENLRDRQNISVLDPSIRLSQLAKNLHDGEYYEAMLQGADADAEKDRAIALKEQRIKTQSQAKPVVGLMKKP